MQKKILLVGAASLLMMGSAMAAELLNDVKELTFLDVAKFDIKTNQSVDCNATPDVCIGLIHPDKYMDVKANQFDLEDERTKIKEVAKSADFLKIDDVFVLTVNNVNFGPYNMDDQSFGMTENSWTLGSDAPFPPYKSKKYSSFVKSTSTYHGSSEHESPLPQGYTLNFTNADKIKMPMPKDQARKFLAGKPDKNAVAGVYTVKLVSVDKEKTGNFKKLQMEIVKADFKDKRNVPEAKPIATLNF